MGRPISLGAPRPDHGSRRVIVKLAIISDIHGNHDAFDAVLEDIAAVGVEGIFSLGDNIGYGGEPDRVIQTLTARGIPSVIGNHELAVRDPEQLEWFNPQARKALERTLELLSAESLQVIATFPDWRIVDGVRLVHGFPPDSPLLYQFQISESERNDIMADMDETVCFIGHTHYPDILVWDGEDSRRIDLARGVFPLEFPGASHRYVINVGSVGQPRDGDNNAKYVVYCPDAGTAELRHVPYDVESAVEKILNAGLPAANAWRLR